MGRTYQSIVISRTSDEVWNAISDFPDTAWTPTVVTKLDIVGDRGGCHGIYVALLGEMKATLEG